MIRLPLGESRCSCPSRSVCRHVIMAILLARQAAMDGGGAADSDKNDNRESNAAPVENSPESCPGDLAHKVWQEILAQPRKPLLRALGSRGLRRLAAAMEAQQAPEAERGTVVRIRLPGQDMTVKLLSPLEYSTCTCHKKELCSHKAEAILWCQYLEKQLTPQELIQELERQPDFDLEELKDTAGQVKGCLEHLLETGLARSGEEQAQELENLAILCHNAGLPGWEGDLRALAEGYEKYLRRAAGQTMERLAGALQRLYDKTLRLQALAQGAERQDNINSQIQALAGEFRSEYLPAGDLELTGITMEHFVSDSGYEGDTVYFLDVSAGVWYTYTNARPTFYEGKSERAIRRKLLRPGEFLCPWRILPACVCCCGEPNAMLGKAVLQPGDQRGSSGEKRADGGWSGGVVLPGV